MEISGRFLTDMTTGLVISREEQDLEDRRAAYRADITYGTWQQFASGISRVLWIMVGRACPA
jgi:preprotein translocase subunit SecA